MKRRLLAILPLALLLSSCDDEMDRQPRYREYERSSLFADGKALQAPPEGAIARDDPVSAAVLATRPEMTLALLQRGRERYDIYCSVCHDRAGYGQGTVPARGFPSPPSFHDQRLLDAPASYFVSVITEGHGVMYSYADRVVPADRWAIAAYIRALQLSQAAPLAALPDGERRRLGDADD